MSVYIETKLQPVDVMEKIGCDQLQNPFNTRCNAGTDVDCESKNPQAICRINRACRFKIDVELHCPTAWAVWQTTSRTTHIGCLPKSNQ